MASWSFSGSAPHWIPTFRIWQSPRRRPLARLQTAWKTSRWPRFTRSQRLDNHFGQAHLSSRKRDGQVGLSAIKQVVPPWRSKVVSEFRATHGRLSGRPGVGADVSARKLVQGPEVGCAVTPLLEAPSCTGPHYALAACQCRLNL